MVGAVLVIAPAAGRAQPYAAAGGFDRPFLLGRTQTLPGVAAAEDRGGVFAFWDDGEGIVQASLSRPAEPPVRLLEGRGFRTVHATSAGGDLALAWVRREPGSGRTTHRLRWRGRELELLEAGQAYQLELAGSPEGPLTLYARGIRGRSVLILKPWGAPERALHSSSETISRYSLAVDSSGAVHISWLEGFNDPRAVGVASSKWTAYYLRVAADGRPGAVVTLGEATNPGPTFRSRVGLAGATPVVQWPTPGGRLVVAVPGQEPTALAPGTALGIADGQVYWTEGRSIRRLPLDRVGSEPTNVVWSPNTPELAILVASGGDHFLAWYGPAAGGGYALRAAHDLSPIRLGLRDRVAARMGWRPWAFWPALGGQLLASLLAGLLVALALTPLFWLLSLLISHRGRIGSGTAPGILISGGCLIALASLLPLGNALGPDSGRALTGTPLELAAALTAGALLTWLLRRRADSETQIGILVSACLNTATSLTVLVFIHFQTWSEVWGRIG
ncbi:MAG: hypothetical protein OXH85_08475 [Truepera sp.]|nr:hypothetical protein [Truepera sp.]